MNKIFFCYSILIFCLNAIVLHAQPDFQSEISALSGFRFCDFISFVLLFLLAETFQNLGKFTGAFCLAILLGMLAVDALILAPSLHIVFDETLLAFTDTTSLSYYWFGFVFLFLAGLLGGLFSQKFFKRNLKKSLIFFSLFLLTGFISLFSGAHSAFDKKVFFLGEKPEALPFPYKEIPIPHRLRNAFGGFLGDLAYISGSYILPASERLPRYKATFPKELETKPAPPKIQTILLVMGESSNPFEYEIYGSKQKTTPFLVKMEQEGLACHLNQVHSTANITRYAVLPSVSFWHPDTPFLIEKNKNLIVLAQEQHFKTSWISKQIENNAYSDIIGYIVENSENYLTPSEAHGLYTGTDFLGLKEWNTPDSTLIPPLKKALSEKDSFKFIGLHLSGSHTPYLLRFEKEDEIALSSASAYTRSIHATDRTLQKIYDELKNTDENGLIFYVSDHGEDVQHGGHSTAFGNLQYQIPLLFIGKEAKSWCEEAEKFRQENGWYSTLSNQLLLSKILGYHLKPDTLEKRKAKDRILLPSQKPDLWEKIPTR
ncbi:hypothetical protein FAI40_02985 [Acetobacteraceae bacterium]|nr:hypothetical protein FAI40_02985 [Acetobacteraceae bacterium]